MASEQRLLRDLALGFHRSIISISAELIICTDGLFICAGPNADVRSFSGRDAAATDSSCLVMRDGVSVAQGMPN